MRRPVLAAATGLTVILVALSLHTLSTAMGDEAQTLPSVFTSPIDPPSTITGSVFQDIDGNGEQDAGEPGIPGVTVALEDTVQGTITTDEDGRYSFALTRSGRYTVTAVAPADYVSTTPERVAVDLTGAGQEIQVDFGYRGIGTIQGTVFDDRNVDGTQQAGEPGISEATITLLQNGSAISTTKTGGDGSYAFTPIPLGEYTVQETNAPGGYLFDTTPNTQTVILATAGQVETVDFGDYGPPRVTGIVFNDLDGDGAQDSGESGIPGVTVELLRDDAVEDTRTTDSNGAYYLPWDDLGEYTVREINLEGYISTSDDEVDVSKDTPSEVEVVNFADRGVGIIHGTVFHDQNGDQELGTGEPGIEGVTITLVQDDTVVRATTTDNVGDYEFQALGLGDYVIHETDPDGYASTTSNTVTATLTLSKQAATANFGDRGIGAIRGVTFDDRNSSQEQDVGEPGIDGVTVKLLQEGSIVFATTTSGGGVYEFDPVWLGEYTLEETDPEGYISTTPNTATVSLTMTNQLEVRDFGDRGVGSIAGTVFSDDNGNKVQDGTEEGIADVTVVLLQNSSTISTTKTASDGSYSFAPLFLGDYTVQEADLDGYASTTSNAVDVALTDAGQQQTVDFGDRGIGTIQGTVFNDEDGDGEQDLSEMGINGVTVRLLSASSVVSETTTTSDGSYTFDPVWLDDYSVQEIDAEGYTSTTPNQVSVSLATPQQLEVVDFGDRGVGSIAGTVFSDDNGNEVQDGTEEGIADVTVVLLQNSSTISTTKTASDGSYSFAPLFLGDYTVQQTDLDGYASTTSNAVDVALTDAGQQQTVDFGDRGIGTIQGTVFNDEDGDGEQDLSEMGINGVTVRLLSASSVVSETTTTSDGSYTFDPVWLDDYSVQEIDPEGYTSTTANQVSVSLATPQQLEVVDFGDRILFTLYLPLVARNHP